ncbi:jg15707, partial [Pararge aegeria aegeria]
SKEEEEESVAPGGIGTDPTPTAPGNTPPPMSAASNRRSTDLSRISRR